MPNHLKKRLFTDQNNRPYVPVSESVSGKMPDQNVTITFYYRLSVPKPDTGEKSPEEKTGMMRLKVKFHGIYTKKKWKSVPFEIR